MNIVSIQFDSSSTEPLYSQLCNHLKKQIIEQNLAYGDKLPAIRTLAEQLAINPVTVINAYKQLEASGYITSKRGSGFYISRKPEKQEPIFTPPTDAEHFINFASASPHAGIFPTETFKEYIVRIIDRDKGFAFGYQEVNGFMPLRQTLSAFLDKTYAIPTHPDLIQIVSGAQQGIDIIAKALLYAGDTVVTELPTYGGALDAFRLRGCRIVSASLTQQGIDLIELEKKVRICKPKLIYVMPNYQNPTTLSYSIETMKGLLDLAKRYNFFILEEDSMLEITYSEALPCTLKSLDTHDQVIYLKSFSKLLMPGLRMGFLIIPRRLLSSFTKAKQASDISSSGLMQRALELYFVNDKWSEHIHYLKEIYYGRYEYMLMGLRKLTTYNISFEEPKGGLCFWLHLPPSLSAQKLYEVCYAQGLLILPSSHFFSHLDSQKDRFIRLSFASCTMEQIMEGLKCLETCIQSLLST